MRTVNIPIHTSSSASPLKGNHQKYLLEFITAKKKVTVLISVHLKSEIQQCSVLI